MKRPLTGLVVVFALGIWAGALVDWAVEIWAASALVALAAFFVFHRRPFSLGLLLVAVFLAGLLTSRQARMVSAPRHVVNLLGERAQAVGLRGRVISDTAGRRSFVLEVQAARPAGDWVTASGRVFVLMREDSPAAGLDLGYGDVVECSAWVRAPREARNPGVFDWRRWLARQRIYRTATIYRTDTCTLVARDRGNPLQAWSLRLRDRFEQALRAGLEDEPKLAGVLAGMVIGERAEIPPETSAAFQRTGVFHIFSVSGLNVTLVGVVVMMVLRVLRVPRRWSGLASIPVLALYVLATGARPGAVRTFVMAVVLLLGWALVRPVDLLNSLAAAALVILVYDPLQLFDGGFILSFAAVTALVVLTPPIEARLGRWVAGDPFLPRELMSWWQRKSAGARLAVARAVSGSLAAWVGLLPLMAVYFNLFAPVSVLANVVVIPLLGVITGLGMLAGVTHGWWNWLTLTMNNANFFLLAVMIRSVEWLSALPYGHWFVRAPPHWWSVGFYGIVALLVGGRRKLAAALAVPLLGATLWLSAGHDDAAEITILDLGRGASAFVNLPGERHDFLLDGGDDLDGERVVVPFLRSEGVDRLAAVVLTCGDKAHAAGLGLVTMELPVEQAIYAGVEGRSRHYRKWIEQMQTGGVPLRTCRAGDSWEVAPEMRVRVLHPPAAIVSDRKEDNVLVAVLESGATRVLWLSDASAEVEQALVASGQELRAQILVREGGGRETSCGEVLLAAVQPEWVVLQTEAWPAHRDPDPEFLKRLARRGTRLVRTAEAGAVTLRLQPDGYEVRTCLAGGEWHTARP